MYIYILHNTYLEMFWQRNCWNDLFLVNVCSRLPHGLRKAGRGKCTRTTKCYLLGCAVEYNFGKAKKEYKKIYIENVTYNIRV